jgi:undecaprenyl-diphosphatase
VNVPPQDRVEVTRTRASRAAPVAIACAVACAAVVGLLGAGAHTGFAPQLRLDAVVSQALYAGDHRGAPLNALLETLTAPGLSVVRLGLAIPVLVLLIRRRAWWTASWLVTALALVGPLTTLLKNFFGRVRPPFEHGGARYDTLSFPSGHSSGIATLVTVGLVLAWPLLSVRGRRLWLLAGVVLALVVGLTRMWLGVHYVTDVIGGWALGVSWALVTAVVFGALPGGRAALPSSG